MRYVRAEVVGTRKEIFNITPGAVREMPIEVHSFLLHTAATQSWKRTTAGTGHVHEASEAEYNSTTAFNLKTTQVKPSMKTNKQVEVILFQRTSTGQALFLMMKRNPRKGGFWQPITGAVEVGETPDQAAFREIAEETSITDVLRLIDTGYAFQFVDNGRQHDECVFGAEVPENIKIILSPEHTEYIWVTKEEALDRYLKYPGNKAGLEALAKLLGM